MVDLSSPVPVGTVALVLLAFEVKHFGADFLLQTDWMAQGKERPGTWPAPLAAHAGLHALGTLLIVACLDGGLWWLAAVDFALHTLIDRGKAIVGQRTRFPVTDARFWWLMGFDQFLHQVTNIALAVILVAH